MIEEEQQDIDQPSHPPPLPASQHEAQDNALRQWHARVVEYFLHDKPIATRHRIAEDVTLALKNRQHCRRLHTFDEKLEAEPRSCTEISKIDSNFDVRFCARTRSFLATGIHRSWKTFVHGLLDCTARLGVALDECEREALVASIADVLWDGSLLSANGWAPDDADQSRRTARRLIDTVAQPAMDELLARICATNCNLLVLIETLTNYENKCSAATTFISRFGGTRSTRSTLPVLPEQALASVRRWHKKLNAQPRNAVAVQRVLALPFLFVRLPQTSQLARLLETTNTALGQHALQQMAVWMAEHASKLRTTCGVARAMNWVFVCKQRERAQPYWHGIDVKAGVDVHQPPPHTRVVPLAPGHIGQFSSEGRVSIGTRAEWFETLHTENDTHARGVAAVVGVVCHLLSADHLRLGVLGNQYLQRVVGCEFVSYEARLIDVLDTELSSIATASGCPLPMAWTASALTPLRNPPS